MKFMYIPVGGSDRASYIKSDLFTTTQTVIANKRFFVLFLHIASCDDAGCEQICVNDPLAGPICRCGEGFTLQVDGVSCKGQCQPRHDKTNKVTVRPAQTQISLGNRPV